MNQFKAAWGFAFANWKFFLILGLPIIAMETILGYLVMPLNEMTQPEDFFEFFETNSLMIGLVGLIGLIVQISFLGGIWVAYMSIDAGKEINPISALQAGLTKFFPLFGAYLLVTIVSTFGYLLLILPGIYLSARFGLFAAQIMFEDNKVLESISSSWEKTDEHGSKLFMFTLVFICLIFISALILGAIIPDGITQIIILSITEYIFIIPLGYIFFTLYKSLKTE
ncbi:MAG: hypothetical protein ACJ0FB_00130 [Gammaproteobacteria bacterium]|jgi:hypothetical protein|tara:strand:- start:64 stop:738 length:675 start_codon:yes stop_codon:yes gene_type:complete